MREFAGLRVPRSLLLGIGLSALALGAQLQAPALAAGATLHGQPMQQGFGRLAISFDGPTTTRVRVSNSVLIVAFSEPVTVDVAKIADELPGYLTVARLDPDRRGLRFALTRPFRANLIEAGDKAFIDLLPVNWTGVLPGPPPEVLAEMAERLRLAEARARESRRPAPQPRQLTVRGAVLPTLERLTFGTVEDAAVKPELADGRLTLTFDKPMPVDPAKIRAGLPSDLSLVGHETTDTATRLTLTVPKQRQIRSFRDEDGLIVDLLHPPSPDALTLAALEAKAAAAPPEPALQPPAPLQAAPPAAPAAKPQQAVAAPTPAPAPAPVVAPAATVDPAPQPVRIEASSAAPGPRIDFRFPRPTGAAAFIEAGILTLAFDTRDTIDPEDLKAVLPELVESTAVTREGRLTLLRLSLKSQQIMRLVDDGNRWSLRFGDQPGKAAEPVAPRRALDERGQTILSIPLPGLTGVHWLDAGLSGTPLAIATATGPVRNLPKPYHYVEFGLPQTAHGIAVGARADDVVVHAGADELRIGRGNGLTVSLDPLGEKGSEEQKGPAPATPLIDPAQWAALRTEDVLGRSREIMQDVADASRGRKSEARLGLARFYAANDLMPEAKGPLIALLKDDPSMRGHHEALFLTGLAALRLHRNQEALAAFDAPPIKQDPEAGLWRALAEQRLGRNGAALLGFRRGEAFLDRYPPALQAELRPALARAALAMRDVTIAEREIEKLTVLPAAVAPDQQTALLRAMLDDLSGRPEAALNGYRALFDSPDRPVAAEAQLRAVQLAQAEKRSDFTPDEAIARLETVSMIWRGGPIEMEALAELSRFYADSQRWRDAFMIARRANEVFPNDPLTRRMHDETAQRFAELFGGDKASTLPRIDALALFYDFKEFLPVGRRGDEITRLLADRLVELDLLDQASEILLYQLDKRLSGAARSTVAARLAMINLMNGKPAEAIQNLNRTRLVELASDVQRARLLLEAKALSDLSRTDQALEMLEGEKGPEIDRLRADIYWTGRRWRDAGEAHERLLGESWRGDAPLTDGERAEVMRTAISYVMADETLSLDRLRSKFAGKMTHSSDARTFAFITGSSRASAADIREMARRAAGADSFTDFMKAYRERYPDYSTSVRQRPKPEQPPAAGTDAAAPAAAARG